MIDNYVDKSSGPVRGNCLAEINFDPLYSQKYSENIVGSEYKRKNDASRIHFCDQIVCPNKTLYISFSTCRDQ